MSHSMNTYSRIPVAFTHGERVWVWDESGKKFLDALAGIAVNTLGHGHARLTRAIAEQSSRLIHTSNLYRIAEQEALADKLAAISGMENAFFCNSGCEANEAAIKIARLYGHGKGVDRSEEHTSELQSLTNLVCRLLLEKKKKDCLVDQLQ